MQGKARLSWQWAAQ